MTTKTPVSKTPAKKPVAKKPAVAKAATPAPVKAEPVKVEPVKVEVVKAEPVQAEPVKTVPAPVVAKAEQPVWPVVETSAAKAPVAAAVAAVAEKITTVAAEAAPVIKKEVTKMENTIKDATVKGEALIADMNTRAKAAMEKGTKAFEQINEFNKGNVEALVESSKIAAKGFETLGQGYAEYARKSFEGMTATMKSFAGVKSPTDFLKLHSEFVKGQFDSMVAETSKNTEAFIKLAGDVAKPISNRVAVAAEKLKVAA
ncbi:MAG: phasin family protein [Sphingomonas sp.]